MNESTDLTSILSPLWRRKWLILLVGLIAASGSYFYFKHKPQVLSVSTQLYFGAEESAGSSARSSAASHFVEGQAQLIGTSLVGEAARKLLIHEHAEAALNGKIHASTTANSQLVTIAAEAPTAKAAAQLANAYASAYIALHSAGHRRSFEQQIARTHRQIQTIEAAQRASAAAAAASSRTGKGGATNAAANESETLQIATLNSRLSQLQAEVDATDVQQIGTAKAALAVLLAPLPRQNAVFGFLVGVLLGAFAVYMLSRLDGRVQSLNELEQLIGRPALAALPEVREPLERVEGSPVPADELLDPLRRLHISLQLAGGQSGNGTAIAAGSHRWPRTLLVVGSRIGDGCSTIAAALALTGQEAGVNVTLIDADLRSPSLGPKLQAPPSPGLDGVIFGAASLEEALVDLGEAGQVPAGTSGAQGDVGILARTRTSGRLRLLAPSAPAHNPPALLGSQSMGLVVESLSEEEGEGRVIIDGSPPTEWSDVLPLLSRVEAVVAVVRIGRADRRGVAGLLEILGEHSAAPLIGVVANGVSAAELRRRGVIGARRSKRRFRPRLSSLRS